MFLHGSRVPCCLLPVGTQLHPCAVRIPCPNPGDKGGVNEAPVAAQLGRRHSSGPSLGTKRGGMQREQDGRVAKAEDLSHGEAPAEALRGLTNTPTGAKQHRREAGVTSDNGSAPPRATSCRQHMGDK